MELFLRNPHYPRKQDSHTVQEEIRLPNKGPLHDLCRKVPPNNKHQMLLPTHSRHITLWLSPTFWITYHLCGTAWREPFNITTRESGPGYCQVSFFYMFFSPNTFTKKRTVLPATGIDLTCLQVHTALTPVSWEKKKSKRKVYLALKHKDLKLL